MCIIGSAIQQAAEPLPLVRKHRRLQLILPIDLHNRAPPNFSPSPLPSPTLEAQTNSALGACCWVCYCAKMDWKFSALT